MRSAGVWAPWMVIVLGSCLFGCTDGGAPNRDRPGGPLYRSLEAGGDRVMVRRLEETSTTTTMKLRVDSGRAAVYDADLTPVGDVRWRRGESPGVRVRFIDDADWTFLPVEDGIWEWPGHVRVEETGRGWAVFGPEAEWLGRFDRREAAAWRLHVDGRTFGVRRDASGMEVGRLAEQTDAFEAPTWRIAYGEMPSPIALSVALEGLSPMERVAVGAAVSIQVAADDGHGASREDG